MIKFIRQLCLQKDAIIENATKDVLQNKVKLDKKGHQYQHHSKCKNKTNNHCEQWKPYCCGKNNGVKIIFEKCANK